jgi:hypothetical protein
VLADRLSTSTRWDITVEAEPFLPDEHAPLRDVIDSVDPSGRDADVVIYLTDLPRRDDTLPVIADVSPEHRFGLVSVPTVGRRIRIAPHA